MRIAKVVRAVITLTVSVVESVFFSGFSGTITKEPGAALG